MREPQKLGTVAKRALAELHAMNHGGVSCEDCAHWEPQGWGGLGRGNCLRVGWATWSTHSCSSWFRKAAV